VQRNSPVSLGIPYYFPEPKSRGLRRACPIRPSLINVEERIGELHENADYHVDKQPRSTLLVEVLLCDENLQASMALLHHNLSAAMFELLQQTFLSQRLLQTKTATQLSRILSTPLLPSAALSIPSLSLHIPGLFADIWDGVLKAVPKKKTSHMKKRHRQLAGKALKDVNSVNTCPACGKPKRAHLLCPYCVEG
jgi:large subunit ribosomal protein L32